jgi:hypothetical protein
MIRSRSPRRALQHLLQGLWRPGASPDVPRHEAGSLGRTINEISAKGLLALVVSWSLAEIALVLTVGQLPPEEHLVALPSVSLPTIEVAETAGPPILMPVTFWLSGEP